MSKRRQSIITALPDKAETLREIARSMNLKFREKVMSPEGFIKFFFVITDEESFQLIKRVPIDVYAFRLVMGTADLLAPNPSFERTR
jgi:hypothetical protein